MKIRYILLLTVSACILFLAGCLKNENTDAGPAGPAGPVGPAGGNFAAYNLQDINLQTSSFVVNPNNSNEYNYIWVFGPYNPKTTYMVSAYVAKVDASGKYPEWNKLPFLNMWQTGDVLQASVSEDTVTLSYLSTSAWPNDSTAKCTIIVIPGQ